MRYDYDFFLLNQTKNNPDFIISKLFKPETLKTIIPQVNYVESILYGLRQHLEQEEPAFTRWNFVIEFSLTYYNKDNNDFIRSLNSCLRYGFNKDLIIIDKSFICIFEELFTIDAESIQNMEGFGEITLTVPPT